MNVTDVLLRLYPGSFRDRWGAEFSEEARRAGWRAWPDLVTNAAGLWLHPTLWPATDRAERLVRATAAAFALTLLCWYVTHGLVEMDPRMAVGAWRAKALSLDAYVVLAGLLLIVPRPRIHVRGRPALALLRRTAVRMLLPVLLGSLVIFGANTRGALPAALTPFAPTLIVCWWFVLALVAIEACRVLAHLNCLAVPPSPRRLKVGIKVLMLGVTLSGLVIVSGSFSYRGADAVSMIGGIALLTLNWAFTATSRDVSAAAVA